MESERTAISSSNSDGVVVKAFGCSANIGEGELAAGALREKGFSLAQEGADLAQPMVLHVCTVKGEASALRELEHTLAAHPQAPLVLSGCVTPELVRLFQRKHPGRIFGATTSVQEVPKALQNALEGKSWQSLGRSELRPVASRQRVNPLVGILPVERGCLDACSFCSTRLIKGTLESVPLESLVEEARALVQDGCQQIWLTGQDAGCYGFDLGTDLARLVQAILVRVPGNYRLRLGMGNPRHMLRYHEALAETMSDPRVFRFLHIPVQSGSDTVLAAMKRRHSVQDYYLLADHFRKAVPELTLSTDIIVGFPGETEEDFEATLQLLRTTLPTVCNRTRFVPRPGTPAAKLPDALPRPVKEDRSARLTALFKQIAARENQMWVGREQSICIDGTGKHDSWVGRNDSYKQVVVKGNFALGERVAVRIEKADEFTLYGIAYPQ